MKYPLAPKDKFHLTQREHFFKEIKELPSAELDGRFHKGHDRAFEQIECLECANCCKTHSPILEQEDLDRLAQGLNTATAYLLKELVIMDEEGDFVFHQQPCPMLQADNKCRVYDHRPKACREYPHTNRKRMHEILDITEINSFVCPAVDHIVRHWDDL